MLEASDIPSVASWHRLDDLPGGGGRIPLEARRGEIRRAVRQSSVIILDVATGTGESKVAPSEIQQGLASVDRNNATLSVLTTLTIDVVDMHNESTVPSCYRMGGTRHGGVPLDRAWIVFATAGLAFQWYASEGTGFLRRYGCVFFDEVADAERSPEYAILWEVAHRISQTRSYPLKLAAASATMSTRMKDVFDRLNARWIVCHSRPYVAERYVIRAIRVNLIMGPRYARQVEKSLP